MTRIAALASLLLFGGAVVGREDGVPTIRLVATVEPAQAPPGAVVELLLKVEVPYGWVAYDLEQLPESVLPTQITIDASERYAPLESFVAPPALERQDPIYGGRIVRYYDDSPTFRRKLLTAAAAKPGETRVSGRIDLVLANRRLKRTIRAKQYPYEATYEVIPAPSPTESAPAKVESKGPAESSSAADGTTTFASTATAPALASQKKVDATALKTAGPASKPKPGASLSFEIQLDELDGLDVMPSEPMFTQATPIAVIAAIFAGMTLLIRKTWNP